jgi:inorganic pyrophosphatase
MSNNYDNEFWEAIDALVSSGKISIDRPKSASHPRFPNVVYPIDYGYIENTSAMDGGGIDVWRGSLTNDTVTAIICTIDLMKKDSEIKLIIGCTEEEISTICKFHNSSEFMKGILIKR